MRRFALLVAGLALLVGCAAAVSGGRTQATTRSCARAYGWPVRPFDRAQPVRGNFCDPRLGKSSPTFHFGIDISAPDGSPVYPTRSGVVYLRADHPDVVGVTSADGRTRFEYWHITPAVRSGERAVAYKTLLGSIKKGRDHVHFTEIADHVWLNPLRPGALTPYGDTTRPVVSAIRFERAAPPVPAARIGGVVDIVADVYDLPSLSAPEPWTDLPVTPAVIRWRLLRGGIPLTGWRTVVDCSRSLPPARAFADVYALGTRQNGPGGPGRFHYYLARGWRSDSLARGAYRIEVTALDVRGNRGKQTLDFTVAKRGSRRVVPG